MMIVNVVDMEFDLNDQLDIIVDMVHLIKNDHYLLQELEGQGLINIITF